jgi:hypothetical protein
MLAPGSNFSSPNPLLARHQLIDPAKEDLGGQVAALLAAQCALHNDGLEREFGYAGRDVPEAFLASHNKGLPR